MNNVLQILKDHKQELMEKYPIKSLALFGSYSRGDYNDKSDIDIMVRKVDTGLHISVTNGGKIVIDKTIHNGDEIDVRL